MNLDSLTILEERIKSLLAVVTNLRSETQRMRTELNEGASLETMLDQKKRQQLRSKVEGLLELLKDF